MTTPKLSRMTTPTGHMMVLQRHLAEYLRQTRLEVFIQIRYASDIYLCSTSVQPKQSSESLK